jgi:hypothetical protein
VRVDAADRRAQLLGQVAEVHQGVADTELLKDDQAGLLESWLLMQCLQHLQQSNTTASSCERFPSQAKELWCLSGGWQLGQVNHPAKVKCGGNEGLRGQQMPYQ